MTLIRILIVDDHTLFRDGLRAILKAVPDIEIVGEALFGPAIATRLTKFFNDPNGRAKQSAFPELTEREFEVLELIARARNNQEIAETLNISMKTVSNHISNIFSKLQVADRTQAIFKARDAGLGNSK